MYVRFVLFTLGPGERTAAEKIADEIIPAIRAQKGCNTCKFFTDDEVGEYGIVVLWESREDADNAASVISPRLKPALSGIVKSPPSIRLYEVYEPKA
jgi:quinol monooxygenase YgiN